MIDYDAGYARITSGGDVDRDRDVGRDRIVAQDSQSLGDRLPGIANRAIARGVAARGGDVDVEGGVNQHRRRIADREERARRSER